jgi:hypothetical protein
MSRLKIAVFFSILIALTLSAAACSKSAGSTPTAVAKAFFDASKAKDVQGIKNALSQKSLEMMEAFAKMGNKSLDESLKDPETSSKQPATFEARNEKITGETATLEVKDETGKWQTMPFVKEGGQWKMAFDKLLEKAFQEPGPDMKMPSPETKAPGPEKSEGEQPKKSEGEESTPEGDRPTP